MKKQKCIICGCTEDRACPGGCHWLLKDLCSNPECIKKYKSLMEKKATEYRKMMEKEDKTKCFIGTYRRSVLIHANGLRGSINCTGFQDQPPCQHLKKCFEQFKDIIPENNYNRINRFLAKHIYEKSN